MHKTMETPTPTVQGRGKEIDKQYGIKIPYIVSQQQEYHSELRETE